MRAVVNAKEFSGALDKVSRAVQKSKFLPVLEEVLVCFTNGRCVLTGTNLETWLTTEIPAQGDDFAFVFHRTASVVRACRHFDGELAIELTETGEGLKRQLRLCMSCGDRVGEFHAFYPVEYPEMPETEPEYSFQANAFLLMERINRIKYATLKSASNTNVCSTSIQFKGSRIYCLDGLRAAWSTDEALSVPKPFLVPVTSMEYLKIFSKQDVSMRLDRRYVDITDNTTHLIFRQAEAVPFDLDSAIPPEFCEEVCCCPDEFLAELTYLKELIPAGQKPYACFCGGRLLAQADECRYQTRVQLEGKSRMEIGFNLHHMADALRQFKGEPRVRMKFRTPASPILLEADGRSGWPQRLCARAAGPAEDAHGSGGIEGEYHMDYETFDQLHRSDPMLFSLAMEVFLDKGRTAIQESTSEELTIAILQKMTVLLMEKNLQGAICAAEAFARMDTGTLLDYARRSGYFIGEAQKEQN